MARKHAKKHPTRKDLMAESWFGVSHNVPARGTAAHKKMVSAYGRSHHVRKNPSPEYDRYLGGLARSAGKGKARKNPYTAANGRVTHPENCPIPLAASMIQARARAKKGQRKPVRFSNCDYRSAAMTMHLKPKDAGTKFKGVIARGHDETAGWITRSKTTKGKLIELSYWANGMPGIPKVGIGIGKLARLLNWWPSSK